jgi:hypothetical protein
MRVEPQWLTMLANDSHDEVRLTAIKRLPAGLLAPFRFDTDWRVRLEVAERIPLEQLLSLVKDEDDVVASTARERLESKLTELKGNSHGN